MRLALENKKIERMNKNILQKGIYKRLIRDVAANRKLNSDQDIQSEEI